MSEREILGCECTMSFLYFYWGSHTLIWTYLRISIWRGSFFHAVIFSERHWHVARFFLDPLLSFKDYLQHFYSYVLIRDSFTFISASQGLDSEDPSLVTVMWNTRSPTVPRFLFTQAWCSVCDVYSGIKIQVTHTNTVSKLEG